MVVASATDSSHLESVREALERVINDRPSLGDAAERGSLTRSIDSAIELVIRIAPPQIPPCPISKLTDELLGEVFYWVVLSKPWFTSWAQQLCLVCHRWNNVALKTRKLWAWVSDLQICSRAWEQRSANSPLAVQIRYKPCGRALRRNSKRVRALDMEARKEELVRLLSDASALCLPKLQELRVADQRPYTTPLETTGYGDAAWAHVPTSLLEQCTQSLRRLSLTAVFIQHEADWRLLHNLTSLTLTREVMVVERKANDSRIPTFTKLREVLANSPQLESLTIHHYLNTNDPEEGSSAKPAPMLLSNLTTLDLMTDIRTLAQIMSSVRMSPKCHISLNEQCPRREGDTIDNDFPSYLAQFKALLIPISIHFGQKHVPKLRSATVECLQYFGFAACDWDEPNSPLDILIPIRSPPPNDRRTPVFMIWLAHSRVKRRFRQILTKLAKALPLHHLKFFDASKLQLGPTPPDGVFGLEFSAATWISFLRVLPNKLRIRIGVNDAMVEFLIAMVVTTQKSYMKSPSGRTQKRRFNYLEGGLGTWPVACIELDASRNFKFYAAEHGNFDMVAEQERLYDWLVGELTEYRDVYTPMKGWNEGLDTLRIFRMRKGSLRAFDVAPQLCEVVEKVYFGERRWDVKEQDNEEIRKEWERTKRRMGRRETRGYLIPLKRDPQFGDPAYISGSEEEEEF